MRHIEGKPNIIYPCKWEFRIIGESQERLTTIVQELVQKPYNLIIKNHSRKGRFISMHLDVEVIDETERNSIYSALSSHPEVKMVL
ncbi:DUF493 domain-containing protein [Helicobacter sp.]|uniref:HP0495 family protein n=1 Tax=Helicobacter sp. TaxID=218 RepID=UPI00388D88A6